MPKTAQAGKPSMIRPLPFDEAIQFFRNKRLALSPLSWRDVWASANVRAFTIARVTALDVLEDVRKEIDRAIAEGVPLTEFQATVEQMLARRGWLSPPKGPATVKLPTGEVRKRLTPWRVETIFRTNVQSAFQAGRFRQMRENATARPWWMYDAVGDARTRPSHAAMDGKIYHYKSPVWATWYPPNGFNCRCTVRALRDKDLERRGLQVSQTPPAVPPDEGFKYNPGEHAWEPDLSKYPKKARDCVLRDFSNGPKPNYRVRTLKQLRDVLSEKTAPLLPDGKVRSIEFQKANFLAATRFNGHFIVSTKRWDLRAVGGPAEFSTAQQLKGAVNALGRRPLTKDEESAIAAWWHECLHNHQVMPRRMRWLQAPSARGRATMEAVIEWTARRTYGQMLDALGGFRPQHQDTIKANGYGYHVWVKNLDALLGTLGVDEAEFLPICREVIESVPMDRYAEAIANRLKARGAIDEMDAARVKAFLESLDLSTPEEYQEALAKTFGQTLSASGGKASGSR